MLWVLICIDFLMPFKLVPTTYVICCVYSFELHRLVDAIQIGTHNICLYKQVDKKNTGCNLKTTELLDCALIWVCAVIRLNTVRKIFICSCGKYVKELKCVNI